MYTIIGRKEEKQRLEALYKTDKPEFVALHGRRRVGKTYLVRNIFDDKEDCVFFYVTGIKDGTLEEQIANFTDEISRAFGIPRTVFADKKNWRAVFSMFTEIIAASKKKKIVVFLDEFPWMVTAKSRLLQMLENFWNRHWSMDGRIKLIICGSASNWIINNIVNNTGGLYNRANHEIYLRPFSLYETKEYLEYKGLHYSKREIVDTYMVLGGIPYYLDQLKAGFSVMQNIERLAFKRGSFLLKEFSNLYDTLFGADSVHLKLVRILAEHCSGLGQEELIGRLGEAKSGGWIVSRLAELEQVGFVQKFTQFYQSRKGIFYKMIDEYSLFYFQWIEQRKAIIERGEEKGYWMRVQESPAWYSWAGCSFEAVCNKHIPLIRDALHLVMADPSQWRYAPRKGQEEKGTQIDLLFDRNDSSITICEIKYTRKPFVITKAYAQTIKNKMEVFKKRTKTTKTLYFAMISAAGLKENLYSEEMVSGLVTLDDLFKEYIW